MICVRERFNTSNRADFVSHIFGAVQKRQFAAIAWQFAATDFFLYIAQKGIFTRSDTYSARTVTVCVYANNASENTITPKRMKLLTVSLRFWIQFCIFCDTHNISSAHHSVWYMFATRTFDFSPTFSHRRRASEGERAGELATIVAYSIHYTYGNQIEITSRHIHVFSRISAKWDRVHIFPFTFLDLHLEPYIFLVCRSNFEFRTSKILSTFISTHKHTRCSLAIHNFICFVVVVVVLLLICRHRGYNLIQWRAR